MSFLRVYGKSKATLHSGIHLAYHPSFPYRDISFGRDLLAIRRFLKEVSYCHFINFVILVFH